MPACCCQRQRIFHQRLRPQYDAAHPQLQQSASGSRVWGFTCPLCIECIHECVLNESMWRVSFLPDHMPSGVQHQRLRIGIRSKHAWCLPAWAQLTCDDLMILQSLHHRGHIALPEVTVTQLPLLRSQGLTFSICAQPRGPF